MEHIDGNEANSNPENLAYACRSCNTTNGAHYARARRGRKTAQYNPKARGRRRPSAGKGITNVAQFIKAISTVKGEYPQMELVEAERLLKETPPNERSRLAREANAIRWGRSRGANQVPF